jgi:hypothetical protein
MKLSITEDMDASRAGFLTLITKKQFIYHLEEQDNTESIKEDKGRLKLKLKILQLQ